MKKNEIDKLVESEEYYSSETFICDAKRYIKAIKERRMAVSVASVSKMGNLQFRMVSCEKNVKNTYEPETMYYYSNYVQFLKVLGYRVKDGLILVSFGNMNMIFNTNYNVIHRLKSLGFITKKTCDILAQKTPNTI